MKSGNKVPVFLIAAIIVSVLCFSGVTSAAALIGSLIKTVLSVVYGLTIITAVIVALIIYFQNKNKKEKETRQKKAPTLSDHRSPESVEQVFERFKTSPNLGSIARTAIQQKKRMEDQKRKYSDVLARRFSAGSITYNKYMALETEYTEAMNNEYLKIANRMVAFNDDEYRMLSSGQYKYDSIPDDIQYERLVLYRQNLEGMRDALKQNETVIYGIEQLMIKLADSDYAETSVQSDIDTLEKQLEFYKKEVQSGGM